MDLRECLRKGFVRKTFPDHELIASLLEMADIKEKAVRSAKVDKQNISAYVSMAYDSLREVLEAMCIKLGYKVLSHVCIAELLKDKVKGFDHGQFDRMRYIRNSINYYGRKIDYRQGLEIIEKIFGLKAEMKASLEEMK